MERFIARDKLNVGEKLITVRYTFSELLLSFPMTLNGLGGPPTLSDAI